MVSALRRTARRSSVTSPSTRMARPGPGKGWRGTVSRGEPAHVVVALDGGGRALERHRLDHVRVERALDQELGPLPFPRQALHLLLEHGDELAADDLALLLGGDDAGELPDA